MIAAAWALLKLVPSWAYGLVAIATLVGAAAVHERHVGEAIVQAKWDKQTAKLTAEASAADHENRAIESRYQSNITEAQHAATLRTQSLQVAAVAARVQSDGLRDDLAKLRREMPSLTPAAINQRADALAVVLDQCQASYRDMAANADRHASDVQTLSDAWPR